MSTATWMLLRKVLSSQQRAYIFTTRFLFLSLCFWSLQSLCISFQHKHIFICISLLLPRPQLSRNTYASLLLAFFGLIVGFWRFAAMRLQDETVAFKMGGVDAKPEDDVAEEVPSSIQRNLVVVGYALTSKKIKSFLKPKLEGLARNKGILFVAIDQNRPLSDQGPFDIVLHKLTGREWRQILEDYRRTHPDVTVLDPPDAIQHLHNRQSMLQCVADMNLSDSYGKVGVPCQLVIKKDASSIPNAVTKAGLMLPLVAKPLVADGSAKSHELSLAFDRHSLQKLEPPLVLQEFVNHGGVMFKVYIVGDAIKVVRRFSLPDVCKRELASNAGVLRFPRVSCAAASADDADLDPRVAELPPRPLLEKVAKELRRRLGLRLFNLDIIREYGKGDQYYVIDINYFPGYGKMPEYEHIFTDFLLNLVQSRYKKRSV